MGGVAKGLLEMGGERIIDRIAGAMRPLTSRMLIISSDSGAAEWLPGAEVIPDERPGGGALAAIATALRAAASDVVVVAWDMPFVTDDVLRPLLGAGDEYDATIWQLPSGNEPLCACYRQSALPLLDAAIARGIRRARDAASILRVRVLADPPARGVSSFLSINTPSDLIRARQLAVPDRTPLARH